ncbi:hypothetical protein BN134_3341 [Cronobacter dublinensis 1210]|uniref:Pentapeptide repeat-containing protein n=1 Tax=Cronobacter dublinensis 1210 TaxID=1208656 RepID=A0ABP1WAM3_9ENTR|nr:hypothetical protein BN134_3341 [Cronobacter dublinensis 1210]
MLILRVQFLNIQNLDVQNPKVQKLDVQNLNVRKTAKIGLLRVQNLDTIRQ